MPVASLNLPDPPVIVTVPEDDTLRVLKSINPVVIWFPNKLSLLLSENVIEPSGYPCKPKAFGSVLELKTPVVKLVWVVPFAEWEGLAEGYRLIEVCTTYAEVPQRWMVVESDKRREADLKQLQKRVKQDEQRQQRRLVGLKHFLAPKGAEKLSVQGKEVDKLKTPETLMNSRFRLI